MEFVLEVSERYEITFEATSFSSVSAYARFVGEDGETDHNKSRTLSLERLTDGTWEDRWGRGAGPLMEFLEAECRKWIAEHPEELIKAAREWVRDGVTYRREEIVRVQEDLKLYEAALALEDDEAFLEAHHTLYFGDPEERAAEIIEIAGDDAEG
jgi:hypothetical protein